MNDKQYNDFIKKQLDENEETHFSDVEHNKNRTWNLIEHRLEKKRIIPLWFYYAAASIIMLFSLGFLFNYEIKLKNKEIAVLNQKVAEYKDQKREEKVKIIEKTDTLRLIKDKLVYIPVIKQNTIIKHDTIVKMITQTDTVFVKEKLPDLIAENEISDNSVNNQNISPNNQLKLKKKRRFVFRFGMFGNNNVNIEANEQLISLKTELK
ncbi:MAG: hypothetical protein ABFS35_13990 [Bacteroidota bacterium]